MNSEFYSVSRIIDEIAIVEFPDKTFNEISLSLLPVGVKEGSILKINDFGHYELDFDEEIKRKKRLLELQEDIFG